MLYTRRKVRSTVVTTSLTGANVLLQVGSATSLRQPVFRVAGRGLCVGFCRQISGNQRTAGGRRIRHYRVGLRKL